MGRTVQMWNPLMETDVFTQDKPWLLNFFDQLKFYPVSAEDILKHRNDFLRGRFHIRIEETSFNLAEYNHFLKGNRESIQRFKAGQDLSFKAEKERWKEQRLDNFISEVHGEVMVQEKVSAGCEIVKTALPGSVWKVLIREGDAVQSGDELILLESMKMEFPVVSQYSGTVEKIYLQPRQSVHGDQAAVAIRTRNE